MLQNLWSYIGQGLLCQSSVNTWFSCDNLSISWLILMKFFNKVPNCQRKIGINFGVMAPTVLELRAKKGPETSIL